MAGNAGTLKRLPLADLSPAAGFRFSWPAPEARARLAASVARHGVLRPPLGIETPEGVALLDGQRRMEAEEQAGVEFCWVRLVENTDAAALWDRLLVEREGAFNPVERGLYLQKRLAMTGETLEALAPEVLPALGLPPRAAAAAEPLWIALLPPRHRDRFAAGELPAQGLKPLLAAPPDDALAALDLTEGFRLGVNKFPEAARLLFECAWREGLSVRAWAERVNIPGDAADADALRERLWALRHPLVSEWTAGFAEDARKISLPPGAQLSHAKGFEGGRLRLTLSFASVEELAKQAGALAEAAERGGLDRLKKYLG